MSNERLNYLKNIKKNKRIIIFSQISLLLSFVIIWELLSKYEIINSFIFSSPSKILSTLYNLYINNNLFIHIYTTTYEILISFIICFILSLIISLILYSLPTLKKILDPFIIMINSLPKIALGPLIIIWLGTSKSAIIFMSLLISLIVSFITIYNGFNNIDKDKLKLFKILKASKFDTIRYLVIPSSRKEIISSLKINISMSLIGLFPLVGEN